MEKKEVAISIARNEIIRGRGASSAAVGRTTQDSSRPSVAGWPRGGWWCVAVIVIRSDQTRCSRMRSCASCLPSGGVVWRRGLIESLLIISVRRG